MSREWLGYNGIRKIIEAESLPCGPKSFYQDDIIEILRIFFGEESCRACGTTDNLTVDHIYPRTSKKSSRRSLYNLQILCYDCNNTKKDLKPGKNGWWPDSLIKYRTNRIRSLEQNGMMLIFKTTYLKNGKYT
jgi:5-methylcytosine-specific restriction endonuclease McrA